MYDLIEAKRSVRKLYTEALVGRGDITVDEAESALRDYQKQLERVFTEVRQASEPADEYVTVPEYPTKPAEPRGGAVTAISSELLKSIAAAYVNTPRGSPSTPRWHRSCSAGRPPSPQDPSTGPPARSSRSDHCSPRAGRYGCPARTLAAGTFVQRFATIIDRRTGEEWTPLSHVSEDQASFFIYDSLLSEYAAMGFEYGYSVARPEALVMWEAQFGDFVNGAQIVIDEYITSGEAKWGQKSGVVLLLPHGFEGQGPDHSSGRIERFMELAANEAFTVAQPSTPASYFHLLRRHTLGEKHRPLIVFTPKSMLRNKSAVSTPDDFTSGGFRPVIGDEQVDAERVERVLLCSGRVTWDLMNERKKREGDEPRTAIVRLEQLYPRPVEELKAEFEKYPNLTEMRWVQDEPANMGPWPHMALHLMSELDLPLYRVSRPESTSPAVGQNSRHVEENKSLMQQAFG
jgi:2-oxoglutarate dehydrogenase E1 component